MNFLKGLGKMANDHKKEIEGAMKFASDVLGSPAEASQLSRSEFSQEAAKAVPATVHMFSGCRDSQTSADVGDVASFGLPKDCGPAGAGGACTHALLKFAYSENGDFSYKSLLLGMRSILKEGRYTQVPQLSSSRQLNLEDDFSVHSRAGEPGKKVLLIGINYVSHSQGRLNGCHNDVDSMRKYLTNIGFIKEGHTEVRVLRDNGSDETPNCENILIAMAWLAEGISAGDAIFFHYSGHGSRMKDDNGDEADGYDETLVPLDFQTGGMIRDDLIHKTLVMRLPEGSLMTAVMDCCHSGSILDLPYELKLGDEESEQLLTGVLSQLMENPNFFGAALQKAVQWVAENPQQAMKLAGQASSMAKSLGLFK